MSDEVSKSDEPIKNGNRVLGKISQEIRKTGVVYLSRIPTKMNAAIVREYLEEFGKIGRVYLVPEEKAVSTIGRDEKAFTYTEGWVEFKNKLDAKRVAKQLNNQQVRGYNRKSQWFFDLWNIKYLHSFKWSNLNEDRLYQNAVKRQRLQREIQLAKNKAEFYKDCMRKSVQSKKRLKKLGRSFDVARQKHIPQSEWTFEEKPLTDSLLSQVFQKRK